MKRRSAHAASAILLATLVATGGCGAPATVDRTATSNADAIKRAAGAESASKPAPTASTVAPDRAPNEPVGPRATDRPANPMGRVFVVEYHRLGESKNTMFRSAKAFRQDLERLHRMGFRPVTVNQYLENRMPLPPGATPAVFTFDDSWEDQVRLKPDGSLDPNCFLGIWQEFAREHPDFPIRATFFVLPDVMFGQPRLRERKLALLKELGCELANHTVNHRVLRKLSDAEVRKEIGDAELALEKLGTPLPTALALPFGVSPRNRALLEGFEHQGRQMVPKAVFLVGADPAPAPTDPQLKRTAIPRIQACEGPGGLPYWLDQVEKGRVRLYVSP